MKKNHLFKKFFLLFFSILPLLLPALSLAANIPLNLNYPKFGGFDLNENQNLNEIVAWFYYFIVGIAGLSVFVMLVWGGFSWLTSAGSPTKISDAKDKISSAFLGLLIILGSYLILRLINPELTMLNLPQLP